LCWKNRARVLRVTASAGRRKLCRAHAENTERRAGPRRQRKIGSSLLSMGTALLQPGPVEARHRVDAAGCLARLEQLLVSVLPGLSAGPGGTGRRCAGPL